MLKYFEIISLYTCHYSLGREDVFYIEPSDLTREEMMEEDSDEDVPADQGETWDTYPTAAERDQLRPPALVSQSAGESAYGSQPPTGPDASGFPPPPSYESLFGTTNAYEVYGESEDEYSEDEMTPEREPDPLEMVEELEILGVLEPGGMDDDEDETEESQGADSSQVDRRTEGEKYVDNIQ